MCAEMGRGCEEVAYRSSATQSGPKNPGKTEKFQPMRMAFPGHQFGGALANSFGATAAKECSSSLSGLKNRSENSAGRGQPQGIPSRWDIILTVLQVNSRSIEQKNGEIWTGQADLQPISFKSDRLLGCVLHL